MVQKKFPSLFAMPYVSTWLSIQVNLGLADATVEAYARALLDYTNFCSSSAINPLFASREHIALYVRDLATRHINKGVDTIQKGFANATMQQRIVAVRLYYDYLREEQVRDDNPVRRGIYTKTKGFGGNRRGILPHYEKAPWIPHEEQWIAILKAALEEPIRNRLMLALSYDAALRREELCTLQTGDIDPTHRLLSLRAEITKSRRARTVPYSAQTGELYAAYLQHRRHISRERGRIFLSESHRNRAQPITTSTWSKTMRALALRAGVPQFTPHTLRHLCLTDLARAGWDIHEIATFAGHRNLESTMVYIHLSGRELSQKLARGMDSIHSWRVQTMYKLLS